MNKCPQCQAIFENDNEFCQNDGTTLVNSEIVQNPFQYSSSDTQTIVSSTNDTPTVVAPNFHSLTTAPRVDANSNMKWVYPVLGLLIGIIVVLGFLAFSSQEKKESNKENASAFENNDKDDKDDKTDEKETAVQEQPQKTVIVERPVPTNQSSSGFGRFPEGSTRYLDQNDISGKSSWELKIMRNEIYARHGYIFKNSALRNHFMGQGWYQPKYGDVSSSLNSVEKSNVKFLKAYE